MDERPGLASRVVLTGLAVSLVMALGVALYIYVRYVRYEPVAAQHVPAELDAVVHINVQQAVVYEPFRKHLLHLFEAGRKGRETRLMHLERKTTLELGVDSREAVIGFGPRGQWLIAVGGLFRRQAVVAGAQRMLNDEGIPSDLLENPTRLRVQSGAQFAVADDGTLVLGQSESLLTRALGTAGPERGLGPPGALASLVARRTEGWAVGPNQRVTSVRAAVRAGEGFPYEVELEVTGGPWDAPLEVFREAPQEPWHILAGLPGAQVTRDAAGHITVRGELDRPAFDQLLARLAGFVRQSLALPI